MEILTISGASNSPWSVWKKICLEYYILLLFSISPQLLAQRWPLSLNLSYPSPPQVRGFYSTCHSQITIYMSTSSTRMRSQEGKRLCLVCVPAKLLQSCLTLCNLIDCQAPLSIGFSRQEYWRGLLSLLRGIFPTQGSNPHLLSLPALADGLFTTSTIWEARLRLTYFYILSI